MSHEGRINDALKQLGEEYRLGMVQPEEYRARRRLLLESWHERDVTTSPGSLKSGRTATRPPPVQRVAAKAEDRNLPKLALIGMAVAAGIAASAYVMFAAKKPPELAPVTLPPQAPPSAAVLATRKAVEDFMVLNAFEPAQVEAVLEHWRGLSPGDRVRAREEPAIRTLRYKLDQNIQAESQLVAPDASPEDRQRLDLLVRFAQELDG